MWPEDEFAELRLQAGRRLKESLLGLLSHKRWLAIRLILAINKGIGVSDVGLHDIPVFVYALLKKSDATKEDIEHMKIDAVILAGGIGSRMGSSVPKQFLEVDGVPIIVHTVLNFERNEEINNITIVCVKDYADEMRALVKKYHLIKVNHIVEGGTTGHESTRNGIFSLNQELGEKDFVIIHDAVRPILPQKIIDSMIEVALKNGNACLAVPCYETVVLSDDGISGNAEIDRNSFMRVQTPQMYQYGLIRDLYQKAEHDGKHDFVYANTLAIHYGCRIYFSPGFFYNFKITTKDDLPFYRALLKYSEDELARR